MTSGKRLPLSDTEIAAWLVRQMCLWKDQDTYLYGLSQRELAKKIGVSNTLIHLILKKGHVPERKVLDKLIKFFNANRIEVYTLTYGLNDPS